MDLRSIWTIARRELRALFDHPTGYILLIVFLAVNDFLFFRQAYLSRAASLRPMLDLLPWVFLFFVPAVTMRAVAEDARSGTLEVVLAQPITELELLMGKYLGQLLFIWVALALTIPIAVGLSFGADLQVGVVIAQYAGAALLAAGFAGVGLWSSCLARNQITAFILGVSVMFILVLVGLNPLLVGLPPFLGAVAARLGVLSHFQNIARGVIDLRDAVYFLTLSAIFLMLGYQALMARKLAPKGDAIKRLRLGTTLTVAALVVLNLFGRHIGGRLDLTPGKAYTLSDATKDLLATLPDFVTIKVFSTKELPPEVALVQRDLDDLLRDYRAAGEDKVRLVWSDPSEDSTAQAEAQTLGVPAVQFNVVGRGELQLKQGYLGLAIQYADGSKLIPVVQRTDDLEYRLSTHIRELTRTERPVVAFTSSQRDRALGRQFQGLLTQLQQTYEVREITLPNDSQPAADVQVLIINGTPDSLPDAQKDRLAAYLRRGGSLLVMATGMTPSQQGSFAVSLPLQLNDVLQPYGVMIRSDMAYDLGSNERVPIPTQFGQAIVGYPHWVRAPSTQTSVVNQALDGIFLPFASTIDTAGAVPGTVTSLFTTSRAGGVDVIQAQLHPMREWREDSLGTKLLAVMVNPFATDSVAGDRPTGRLVVVGSADFAGDRFARSAPENHTFVMNAVDWMAQDVSLISIRAKDRTPPRLSFSSDTVQDVVKYANVIGVPLALMLIAVVRLWRRRQLTRKTYRSRSPVPQPAAAGAGAA